MSVKAYHLRLCLFAVVALLVSFNALALWGEDAAHRVEAVLQLGAGLGAVVCGLTAASRMSGLARWWRLFLVVALAAWLVGQILWWTGGRGVASPAGVGAYLMWPVFALAAVLLLMRSFGGVIGRPDGPLPHSVVTTAVDGVVAGASFLILLTMGDFGARSAASLPRSGKPIIEVAFALADLVVVVAAMVVTMVYHKDRPYRANYLLLAGGIVSMAASDRLIAYFDFLRVVHGDLWAGIGFVLGPLMIAFAMLSPSPRPDGSNRRTGQGMDWAQLILPYLGFLGIALLFAFHVSVGQALGGFVVWATVATFLLVVIRQVVATRAQHLLTQRLDWAQRGLAYQVQHDALTGLPNRRLFAERLEEAMRGRRFVLIVVDLDDFKAVNDRYGHAAGDDLLRAVGERLKQCLTDVDTLARIGGDEFAMLIDGEAEEPEVVADRLRVALRDPFPVHGSSVRVAASMGLARPGAEELLQTSEDLLRQADVSMYTGKRLGKNTAVVYHPSSGVALADFPTVLRQAAGGVPAGFSLAYQPVVRLPDGMPVAVEALARWTAPNGLDIPPETFVAVAEAAGLGADLDALVLDLVCSEVQAKPDLDIHVNVGAARLGNPSFEEHIRHTLARHRIAPSRLVMEITETVPIVDLTAAAAQIKRLNALGIKVALDDFGAGYNSLTYLHVLPVQIVKLDRSLAVVADPERDVALYRSVIGLCDALGLVVIAEGIESTLQAETVYNAGCRLAQGQLFGTPVPIAELDWEGARRRKPV